MAPLLLVFVSLVTVNSALAARIIGITSASSGSHYFVVKKTMEELSSRGHEVVVVKPSMENKSRSDEDVPHKTYQVPFDTTHIEKVVIRMAIEEGMLKAFLKMNELRRVDCEHLLNNTELLQSLRNFDLVVYEGAAICSVLVADLLGIPRVVIFPVSPNVPVSPFFQIPFPVSYVPVHMTSFTSKMSFIERLMNFGVYIFSQFGTHFMFTTSMSSLKEKYNITPELSYQEALANYELLIIEADFALEYPQPLLPGLHNLQVQKISKPTSITVIGNFEGVRALNSQFFKGMYEVKLEIPWSGGGTISKPNNPLGGGQIMVGPITVQPKPNPLPPDLVDFINSAGGKGFIIVSFGSYVQTVISKAKIDIMAAAFGKLKQKVIWKLKGYIPSFLNANIKAVSWLPQNDLLAHKDIKAFVSHVGHHSLYESAYHGVPLVAFPLFGDQPSNAKKVEHFGLGVAVDHQTVNAEQLLEAIERVVSEPRFKTEAMRISQLMKDSPRTPLEKTGDWIEYVLRHGGARHLRAQVFNVPWYQYYLLDVIAFLVAVVTLVVLAIRLACRCMCRVCCRRSNADKTKTE